MRDKKCKLLKMNLLSKVDQKFYELKNKKN